MNVIIIIDNENRALENFYLRTIRNKHASRSRPHLQPVRDTPVWCGTSIENQSDRSN